MTEFTVLNEYKAILLRNKSDTLYDGILNETQIRPIWLWKPVVILALYGLTYIVYNTIKCMPTKLLKDNGIIWI